MKKYSDRLLTLFRKSSIMFRIRSFIMAMNVKQASEKWNISDRRVRTLCANGQIDGAYRIGKIWYIPDGADKPKDGRIKTSESLAK